MNVTAAQARIREVQRIMERTTLYTLLPGTAAIVGGFAALAGCFAGYLMIRSVDLADLLRTPMHTQIAFCVMWLLVGLFAVTQEIIFTTRAARRHGLKPMTRPARFVTLSLTPSVLVAVVLTVEFLLIAQPAQLRYIVPAWMMCYGTGVYAAGLFSYRLPRLLGLAFIVSGALGLLLLPQYGLVLAAFSFGLLHIVFGILVLARQAGWRAMKKRIVPDSIDPVIHERARLAIVSALAVSPEMSFGELKDSLELSDGNLSAHARTLETAGYIKISKTFRGRRPLTTMRLTGKGRKAFNAYLDTLRQVIDHSRADDGDDEQND